MSVRSLKNNPDEGPKMTGANGGAYQIPKGETTISSSGEDGFDWAYRGYKVPDLAKHCTLEEVMYLFFFEKLPSKLELSEFCQKLWTMRKLPQKLKDQLESIGSTMTDHDLLGYITMIMGLVDRENIDYSNQIECAMRLVAVLPPALAYWYHFTKSGIKISEITDRSDSISLNYLKLIRRSNDVQPEVARVLDSFWITILDGGVNVLICRPE